MTEPKEYGSLDVNCPTCKAKIGKPCVYINDSFYPREFDRTNWIQLPKRIKTRKGDPTTRPHTNRIRKGCLMTLRARRLEAEKPTPAELERSAILRANADALAHEHHELAAWFQAYGSILL